MTVTIDELRALVSEVEDNLGDVLERAIDVIEAQQTEFEQKLFDANNEVLGAQLVAQSWKNEFDGQTRHIATLQDERDTWRLRANELDTQRLRLKQQVAQQQQTVWSSMGPDQRKVQSEFVDRLYAEREKALSDLAVEKEKFRISNDRANRLYQRIRKIKDLTSRAAQGEFDGAYDPRNEKS